MASRKRRRGATLAGKDEPMDVYVCSICERNDKDNIREDKDSIRDNKDTSNGRNRKAVGWCPDCEIYLCTECLDSHRTDKFSRNHVLINEGAMPRRPYCDRCEFECKTVEAAGYCRDCEMYLCEDCRTGHRKIRTYRLHVVLDRPDMPRAPPHRYDCNRKRRAEWCRDIQVRGGDGFSSWISGCAALPGGRLVVLDRHNRTLKLANLDRNTVHVNQGLYSNVGDITTVSDSQVAVTCPDDQLLCFVDVTDTLRLDRKVKVDGQCRGIASLTDRLVVTFVEPVKVEILSFAGDVLQNVVGGDVAKRLFIKPWYIEVSPDRATLYIADHGQNNVTSLSLTGEVRATYQDDRLAYPYGLTVDESGYVYVCGYGSNNVVQMTSRLKHARHLITKAEGRKALGLARAPEGVAYSQESGSLYVGMLYSDDVKEFKLKY